MLCCVRAKVQWTAFTILSTLWGHFLEIIGHCELGSKKLDKAKILLTGFLCIGWSNVGLLPNVSVTSWLWPHVECLENLLHRYRSLDIDVYYSWNCTDEKIWTFVYIDSIDSHLWCENIWIYLNAVLIYFEVFDLCRCWRH